MPSTVSVERTIMAPPEAVYDVGTNVRAWAEVIPAIQEIEVLTDGPVKVGTRFRETRKMFGKNATEEMEFVEMERPRLYVLAAESHGSRYRTEFHLAPIDGGTTVRMVFTAVPQTAMAKVMSFLMKPMMKKLADMCAKDLDALKAHVEARQASA